MKIDCTITKNYLKETQRMCDYYSDCLEGCPATNFCKGTVRHNTSLELVIQAWSDLHPQKTYLEDLMEKYPNVPRNFNGRPRFCPGTLGLENVPVCGDSDCYECWNQPLQ